MNDLSKCPECGYGLDERTVEGDCGAVVLMVQLFCQACGFFSTYRRD